MDGANVVAGISVVVAGATAMAAPLIAGRTQLRADAARLDRERELRDRDEVRTLVDQIATWVPTVTQAQAALRSAHSTSDAGDLERVGPRMQEFIEAREEAIRYDTRLMLRLGSDHPVRLALAHLIEAVSDAGMEVVSLVTLDQPRPHDWLERSANERLKINALRMALLAAAAEWMQAVHRDRRI